MSPNKSQFGFSSTLLILGVIVLAIVLITGGYYLSKLIPKWEIYANSDYGFTFQYPSGWIIQEIKHSDDQYGIYIKHPSDLTDISPEFYIYVWSGSDFAQDVVMNTSVAGIPAIRSSLNDNTIAAHEEVAFKRNDYLYDVGIHYNDGKRGTPQNKYDKQVLNIFKKILTTFKFTDGKPNTGSACINDKLEILSLIDKFENLQQERKAIEVLGLFTPPLDGTDIETEVFLSGKKTFGTTGLYGNVTTNFNLTNYEIIGNPNPVEHIISLCVVHTEEQRSYYTNAGEDIGYQPPQPSLVSFDVIRRGNIWKIDRYYPSGNNSGKYSAWGYTSR